MQFNDIVKMTETFSRACDICMSYDGLTHEKEFSGGAWRAARHIRIAATAVMEENE